MAKRRKAPERLPFHEWLARRGPGPLADLFREVREEDLKEPRHLLALGSRQYELLLWSWAVETLRLYVRLCPHDAEGRVRLACALADDPLADPGEARAELARALALAPASRELRAALRRFRRVHGGE